MNAKLEKIHEDMKKAEEKELFFRRKKEEFAKRYEQEQMSEVKDTLRMGEMTPAQFEKMMNFLMKNKHAYGKDQKQNIPAVDKNEGKEQKVEEADLVGDEYDKAAGEIEFEHVDGGENA